ncbi:hypothetical protein [Sphingomonas crocodyli]|uniref:STAS/SEC14 domain-containing protein n=1 Tax=Sphingomonas crocodyli TaxID=1979270 RepID=A0A437MB29_9SPHN|nr:hypothetical protein [Sphingomonas crocodyli]RVT94835.1 hypothetical protein EOD43_13765 [Sphingomonas crocodyli]
MATEHFRFEIDHSRRFLKIILDGIWTRETVDLYREAVRKTVRDMAMRGVPLTEVAVLIDTRALPVQSRDVADYYAESPLYPAADPRRIATLVVSRLVGIQVRRVGTGVREIFENEQEAIDWLFAP